MEDDFDACLGENGVDLLELTPVQKFYYGKNIFLTGATGTVGKFVLEKLLRCCPSIGMIYILVRPKKGMTPNERLEKMFDSELFQKVKEKVPNWSSKVRIVDGDLEQKGLGINDTDVEELRNNIHITFHSAAKVQWDEPIRVSTQSNLCATQEMLRLVREFHKLQIFVYVSSFFVYRDSNFTVPEHITKTSVSPAQLLSAMEWLNDDHFKMLSPHILKGYSNTYLLTKAVAENLILEKRGSIPTAIVRPGLITGAYKDPIPGYGDTIQSPQGIFIAAAKGFLRTLYSFPGLKLNIVPADTVANTIITTAWHAVIQKKLEEDIFVVNCVLNYDKLPMADEDLLGEVMKKRDLYPLVNMYRYPDFTLYRTPLFYYIHATFDHYIPAIIGDSLLMVFTGKPIMLKLYKRINYMFGQFLQMGKDPWLSESRNYKAVMNSLSDKDNEMFFMNMDDMNWSEYIENMLIVGRRVIAHEDPSNIPYAKKKAKIWLYTTTFLKWCFIFYLFTVFLSYMLPDTAYETLDAVKSNPELSLERITV